MSSKKKFFKVLPTILVSLLLCIACGERNVIDAIQKIYAEGIERIEKADNGEDLQSIYNEIILQVNNFKEEHQAEIVTQDSIENILQKAEDSFLKECCIRASYFDSGIETDRGYASIDDNGNLFIYNATNDDYASEQAQLTNPLNIINVSPIYSTTQVDDEVQYHFERLSIQTPNGDYIYDDEEMEEYAIQYVVGFFWAYMIAKNGSELAPYLKEHFTEILANLPLNESYPQNIREHANKIYYDYKDKLAYMTIYKREYGYIEFAYEKVRGIYGEQNIRCFKLYRDKDTGRLMLGTTIHGYNPPNAY